MKPITKMDKVAAKVLGNACQAALTALAAEYGVTLTTKGGRYDPEAGTYTPKFVLTLTPTDGSPAGEDAATFRRYAELGAIGALQPEHLGASFTTPQGTTYQIVGLRPRKRQSVIAKGTNGKLYCFEPSGVAKALGLTVPTATLATGLLTLTDPRRPA